MNSILQIYTQYLNFVLKFGKIQNNLGNQGLISDLEWTIKPFDAHSVVLFIVQRQSHYPDVDW